MQLRESAPHVDYWEERANKVLAHFSYSCPDEIDMYDICWNYGIRIKPLDRPFLDESLDWNSINHLNALSVPNPKGRRGTIYLKSDINAVEKKLLLAEEFCHLYAHYQSQTKMATTDICKAENQARRMAAYLLMPTRFIKDVYHAAVEEAVLISDIADYFVVSEEFVQYRMELIYNRHIDAIWRFRGEMGTVQWIE